MSYFAIDREASEAQIDRTRFCHSLALALLPWDFMRSGRLPIRKNNTSTSQQFKQFELYRSWIFLRVQQKLVAIKLAEVELVGDCLSSPLSRQVKPVQQSLLWFCNVVRPV
jgi:hypothetical protein